jgi:two-component system, chemotaxis family, chemotaxis protein CheY
MNVVVCDDDAVSRMAVVDLVSSVEGLTPIEARDGEEAVAALLDSAPLLCISDLQMPGMTGIELMRLAKRHRHLAKLPFVVISSAADRANVVDAIQLGAVHYILKPFDFQQAREQLDRVLQQVWALAVEDPVATQKRLNLTPDRLGRYYKAFTAQLEQAQASADALSAQLGQSPLMAQLPTLMTACATLGLWRGEAVLKVLADPQLPPEPGQGFATLLAIQHMVQRQEAQLAAP